MNENVQTNFHHMKNENRTTESERENLTSTKHRVPHKPSKKFHIFNKDEDTSKSNQQ